MHWEKIAIANAVPVTLYSRVTLNVEICLLNCHHCIAIALHWDHWDTDYISDNWGQQSSIKSNMGQHSQFLQCFRLTFSLSAPLCVSPQPQIIPDICHLNHQYISGEKSVMWRNFRFQYITDVGKFDISPHAEEFQIFWNNRCGEMWNFAKFGGISHISTWQMWRNPQFTLFCCCKICFVTNYAVFAKSVLARITCFCVEKNWARWRKKLQISGMSQIHPSIPNPLIGPWWYIRLWHLLHEGKMCG